MNREAIDTWLGRTILVLVLAVLVFGALAWGGVRPTEFVILQWLLIAVLAVWMVRLGVQPKLRFLMPPTAWAVLPFVAYAVWRYRTADIEYLARQEFIQVALAALLFLAIVNNLYGQTALRIIAVSLVAVGTLVAMYGIYQWLTGSQRVWWLGRPGYEGRGSGTYVCPNHFAGFLEMICPLAITFTVLRGFSLIPRILFAYASLVMLVGIASSGSRGGWMAMGVAISVLSLVLIRKKSLRLGVLVLLLVVGGTGTWLYSRVIEPRFFHPENNRKFDDVRFRLWASAKQMWKDHPAFGVGPDHFDHRYRSYRLAHWEVQSRPNRAHNDYWNTLADWGLVGLLLVLAPVGIAGFGVGRSWKNLHRAGETAGNRAALVLGASIGLVAILVHSFFDFNMHIPANAFLATTLLAVITAHWRFVTQSYWLTARWPVRIAGTLMLASAGWYLGLQAGRHTAEVRALTAAERFPPASNESIAALENAFRLEPKNAETALAIGEQLRARSFMGDDDYLPLARKALEWFETAAALNRWEPNAPMGAGMCLDWIGRHAEAEPYFRKALQLDPNHWRARAMMGWHYFQAEQFAEVRPWMQRSLELRGINNPLAYTYINLADKKQAEEKQKNAIPAQ